MVFILGVMFLIREEIFSIVIRRFRRVERMIIVVCI